MEQDERFRWIENCISASIKPRAEELKQLFANEENRFEKNDKLFSFVDFVVAFVFHYIISKYAHPGFKIMKENHCYGDIFEHSFWSLKHRYFEVCSSP